MIKWLKKIFKKKCYEDCDFCELSDEECKARTLEWLQSEVEGE